MKSIKIIIAGIIFGMLIGTAKAQDSLAKFIEPFTKIDVSGSSTVILSQGDKCSIRIDNDEHSKAGVQTNVKNGKLVISGSPAKLYITVNNLQELELSGVGNISSNTTLITDKLEIKSSGTGKVSLMVNAKSVKTDLSGTGKIVLSGIADNLDANISGAGVIEAGSLVVTKCKADISGIGKILVDVKDTLNANISGSGSVYYVSQPVVINNNISGIGSIEQGDASDVGHNKIDLGPFHFDMNNEKGDHIFIGGRENDTTSGKHHHHHGSMDNHWAGFELGVNGYNSEILPKAYQFLSLKLEKSIAVNFNFFNWHAPIYKDYIRMVSGLGLTYNNYRFSNNTILTPHTTPIAATYDTINDRKSKLVASYITLPLMLEFNTSYNQRKNWHLDIGIEGAYKVGSHSKRYYTIDNTVYKPKDYADFNLNPFRYDATVRMGYGHVNFFANYMLSTLFKSGGGPELHPITVGLTIVGF